MFFVIISWVIFKCEDLSYCLSYLKAMFGGFSSGTLQYGKPVSSEKLRHPSGASPSRKHTAAEAFRRKNGKTLRRKRNGDDSGKDRLLSGNSASVRGLPCGCHLQSLPVFPFLIGECNEKKKKTPEKRISGPGKEKEKQTEQGPDRSFLALVFGGTAATFLAPKREFSDRENRARQAVPEAFNGCCPGRKL